MNKVYLVGNIGQPPKSGTSKNGYKWCNASIATQKKKKDSYQTTWHRVVAWNQSAEILASCQKGDTVFIEGELANNEYQDKDGKKISQLQVVASLIFKSARKSASEELGFGPEHESGFEGEQGF